MDNRLTPASIYELVAELGFKKYFHLGGFEATRALIKMSMAAPDNLLHYFGYGLYVGRT